MGCRSCGEENQTELSAEIMIHLSRPTKDNPAVLVFPKVLVCLKCGFAEFTIEETELRQLGTGVAAPHAA
jgi:hypothetical protein